MAQLEIPEFRLLEPDRGAGKNTVLPEDLPIHNWYRFVLSFPPHLVRKYLTQFEVGENDLVLDPFCGTGTTIVEAKKNGIPSVGIEAVEISAFAASTKCSWGISPQLLRTTAESIALIAREHESHSSCIEAQQQRYELTQESRKLLIRNSISPLPLHKCLLLRELIASEAAPNTKPYLNLALASTAVRDASNLHFGPEVGVGRIKEDADVFDAWVQRVREMARDLEGISSDQEVYSSVLRMDSRFLGSTDLQNKVSAVITSPPYPNEKDYTRTVRLESVLLGMIDTKSELRETKKQLIRSNTRGVYVGDDDDVHIDRFPEVTSLADAIEKRRLELGKTSGFERLYHRVTKLYFGGMKRHLESIIPLLRRDARLAYVVGDQASYLRIHIRTGEIIAKIAESLGFVVDAIDLFRTRAATATRSELREEVVVLRWPGKSHGR